MPGGEWDVASKVVSVPAYSAVKLPSIMWFSQPIEWRYWRPLIREGSQIERSPTNLSSLDCRTGALGNAGEFRGKRREKPLRPVFVLDASQWLHLLNHIIEPAG